MPEDAFRHGSKPAPDQTEVGRSDLKSPLEEECPQIRGEGRAHPNQDCTGKGESQVMHDAPNCSCLIQESDGPSSSLLTSGVSCEADPTQVTKSNGIPRSRIFFNMPCSAA